MLHNSFTRYSPHSMCVCTDTNSRKIFALSALNHRRKSSQKNGTLRIDFSSELFAEKKERNAGQDK